MKFLNKTLCIVALLAISEVSAKRAGVAAAPARVTPPGKPAVQPAAQAQSFQQLRNRILNQMNSTAVIDAWENRFQSAFIKDMSEAAKQIYDDRTSQQNALKSLLQTGRDKFASFEGDDEKDLGKLQELNVQIEQAIKAI